MKRALFALTLLLGLTMGRSAADYIVIIADVGQSRDGPRTGGMQGGNAGQQGGGAFGVQGGGAFGVRGGGAFGVQGGGAIGGPPGAGAGGRPGGGIGMGGGGMFGNIGMGGGAFGVQGGGAIGGPPGGAIGGPPGGAGGAIGGPPGGAIGGPPGGAIGGPPGGAIGGPPGGAIGGPPGGANFGVGGGAAFGLQGGNTPPTTDPSEPRFRLLAVVEAKNKIQTGNYHGKNAAFIKHKWGESPVWGFDVDVNIILGADGKPLPAVAKRFEDESKKVRKDGQPSADRLIILATWALEHGLIKEFETTMDELAEKDKSAPIVVAYLKVRDGVRGSLPPSDAVSKWTQRLFNGYQPADSNHYQLLHRGPGPQVPEVKSRLAHLEDTFAGFYYWHALKGKALPMPKQKIAAVLMTGTDLADAFTRHNKTFDASAITSDSFFTARHDLAVYCATRLDQPYGALIKSTAETWKHLNIDQILQAKPVFPKDVPWQNQWRAQTFALLIKAATDEGEIAATSHTGTRQLLIASGLLPGSVVLPRWIESGTGSVFQTPAGSPWRAYGAPHFVHLLRFRELKEQGKISSSPITVLRQVVTDSFFREGKSRDGSPKARATAWALAYFLAQKKTDALHAYFTELSKSPRDLDLDDDALLDCFARATGCVDDNKRSESKLTALAEEWFSYIGSELILEKEALPLFEMVYKMEKELEEERTMTPRPRPGGGNSGGGAPGYPPGGGGGGAPGFPGGGGGGVPGFPGGGGGGVPGFPGGGAPGRPGG